MIDWFVKHWVDTAPFKPKEKKGGDHYLIGNLDRGILGRHVTEMVRIQGKVDHHIGAIFADSLVVKKGDKWKKIWTLQWEQDEIYRRP